MSAITLDRRSDGVAVVTFDTPDSPVNILSRELFDELPPILDEIESDDSIRACVLASGKPGTFIAGANLKQLLAIERADDGEAFSRNGRALLDRIEASPKPVVAAIDGAALGGGLEVALACHYLLASDDPRTVLALPEVQLGLLPGAGGTQRLPRRIGLVDALPMLLTGKRIRARRARKVGLIDALTSPGGIVETAAKAALGLADGKLRPKRRKRPLVKRTLESGAFRGMVLRKARDQAARKTRGLYPAPPAILDCVETGLSRGVGAGGERESVLFGRLTVSPEAKNLIGLFQAMTDLKKPAAGAEPRPVERLGILGGGFMGAGIAAVSVPRVPVVVKDISDDVLGRCAATVYDGLRRRIRSGAITRFERDRQMARMMLTTDDAALAGANLVIEAVFEDLDLKRRIVAETEAVISPDAVLASNTSALPIAWIAEGAKHPERILGMHYFSPVPRMPLLEIIVAERTADWAVATARAFGVRQGKTCIVVRDGPGFYTSRILSPFIEEAVTLVEEGARIEDVDRAIKDFGYPVGPLALLDEVGIDVAAHVAENFGDRFEDRGLGRGSRAFVTLREHDYLGRKNRRGFYVYEDDGKRKKKGKKRADEAIYPLLGGAPRRTIPAQEIVERLAFLMINEAVYCLQEEILASPRDGDVGAILGLGFPPFRGGPFRYLDALGAAGALEIAERHRERGPRFEPAPLLRDMAREGRRFYV